MTKKPRKFEPFWFDGGPLPIKLCYAATPEAWNIAIKQMGLDPVNEPYPDETAGRCTTFDGTEFPELVVVVTINVKPGIFDEQVAGLIAHEAVHLAQETTLKMFPYDSNARLDKETEAYLVQWTTQNVFGRYMEHVKDA